MFAAIWPQWLKNLSNVCFQFHDLACCHCTKASSPSLWGSRRSWIQSSSSDAFHAGGEWSSFGECRKTFRQMFAGLHGLRPRRWSARRCQLRIEFQTSTCQEGFPSKVLVLEDGSLEMHTCTCIHTIYVHFAQQPLFLHFSVRELYPINGS